MYNGRRRTLVVCETIVFVTLFVILAALFVYVAFLANTNVSWASIAIPAAAVLAECVRRFRHLRTDLRHDYMKGDGE